jgi:hypothetical protein
LSFSYRTKEQYGIYERNLNMKIKKKLSYVLQINTTPINILCKKKWLDFRILNMDHVKSRNITKLVKLWTKKIYLIKRVSWKK